MTFSNETDGYDAADNSYGCWKLATRMLRLDAIRSGKAAPRPDDKEEMDMARNAGIIIVDKPAHHRSSP